RHAAKLDDAAWARIVDLNLADLDSLDPASLGKAARAVAPPHDSSQTRTIFAEEAARITDGVSRIVWQRPSRGESPPETPPEPLPPEPARPEAAQPEAAHLEAILAPLFLEGLEETDDATEIAAPVVAGSSTRGIILHKLMEEVLTGE